MPCCVKDAREINGSVRLLVWVSRPDRLVQRSQNLMTRIDMLDDGFEREGGESREETKLSTYQTKIPTCLQTRAVDLR